MKTQDEYIIVNKSAIQKRMEHLKKPIAHHDGIYVSDEQRAEYEALYQLLFQSIPLQPEIEKTFRAGMDYENEHNYVDEYIRNLKLDI